MTKAPQWKIKAFDELSTLELYQCLFLRSEVFIVEQNCVYNDLDNKDFKALHLIGEFQGEVVAYARLFKPNDYFENASIGRVVIRADYRDRKWGHELMKRSIEAISEKFGENQIEISAQIYLKKFYESHGFLEVGDPYLEDGIPHIRMSRS